MKIFTHYFETKRPNWSATVLSLLVMLVANVASAQTYLDGVKTGDYFNPSLAGTGDADVSAPMLKYSSGGFRYFYGASGILNGSTTTSANATTLKSSHGIVVVPIAGADVYIQFRNTANAEIDAGKTTYFKLGAKPVNTGLKLDLAGILGLQGLYNIKGSMYKNAGDYTNTGSGTENVGTPITNDNQTYTDLIIDKNDQWFAAVTPPSSEKYNSVRLKVALPDGLQLLALSSVSTNVYNAFTLSEGASCSSKPIFTSFGNTGISLSAGALLAGLDLGQLVENAYRAIDDDPATASGFKTGIGVSVASTVAQSFYFDRTATATEGARVHLAISQQSITAGVLSGGIKLVAYKGKTEVGTSKTLTDFALLGLNVLDLITINGQGYRDLTFTYAPGAAFDRIEVQLTGLASVGVLSNPALQIFDVGLAPLAPALTKTKEYIFTGTQPLTEATTNIAGDKITWLGPLPLVTVVGTAAQNSAYRFPTTLTLNGNYAAVTTKAACTVYSDQTKLQVIVLTDESVALPSGIVGTTYASGGFIKATSPDHTFTFVPTATLPDGIAFNQATGAVTASGALATVTVPTVYNITVDIRENNVSTGLTLTKSFTLYPKIVLAGGAFPATNKNLTTYTADLTTLISGPASGGKGTGYIYTLSTSGLPNGRTAGTLDVPTGFTLSPAGILTGNPNNKAGDYTFTVYVNDGVQETSAPFTLSITATALPVTLTSFKATKEGQVALLNWATTAESNSERFDLERSQNGKVWEVIGTLASHGESSVLRNYSLSDQKPLNGQNLYRLKMIDRDGTFANSRIESLIFNGGNLSVYPNPVTGSENIQLSVDDWSKVKSVRVLNQAGKIVFESQNALSAGINAQNLTSGLYVIQITRTNGSVSSSKIIKK